MRWDENAADPQQSLQVGAGRRGIMSFIGIDWGHYPDFRPVLQSDTETEVRPALWVEQNSAIMCVAPAWKLAELLQGDDVVEMRREREQEWMRKYGRHQAEQR
jgi:hypothetical protein